MGGESEERTGVHFLMPSDRLQESPSEAGAARRGTRPIPPSWTPAELQSLVGPPQGCHRSTEREERSRTCSAGPPGSVRET